MKKLITQICALLFFSQVFFGYVSTDKLVPNFELIDSFGNEVSLESYEGKMIILEWTNHGCPFVAKHYQTGNMQATQNFAAERDVIWLSIISSAPGTQGFVTSEEANELTVSRNASPTHVLFDPKGEVGKLFGAKTTPHMYIIDEKGLMKYQGAIDDAGGRGFMNKDLLKSNNYVKESLEKLQEGKILSSPSTKPYGCSVKYAS